ncbi:hypothetical protein Ddye_011492 [Dipteronia dyeriana]|uniref:Uncharacterized protein n=1 Tax=Dipteronia dyeriana TaxID=168575 RepID=A0AAD9X2M4_9ROSI|nr:hypothetical protein Ddye_011492 [Dipteronia dyeriana]
MVQATIAIEETYAVMDDWVQKTIKVEKEVVGRGSLEVVRAVKKKSKTGARQSSKVFWESVLIRIERRLAPWKKKFLRKCGRLVLIKAILSGIPTYYMCIFKMPVSTALSIEKLQRASPFVRVVGSLFVDGTTTMRIIGEGFKKAVGNGSRTQFWNDRWIGEMPLKRAFPRIFALASKKEGTVSEFGRWDTDEWIWDVQLRRRIFGWETEQWNRFEGVLGNASLIFNSRTTNSVADRLEKQDLSSYGETIVCGDV